MIELSDEQQNALMACFNDDIKTLFITGDGGTGKSLLIKELVDNLSRVGMEYILLAPTHSASENIDGVTIHSYFKIAPVLNIEAKKEDEVLFFDLDNIDVDGVDGKVLIIDEASMLGGEMFDKILARVEPVKMILFGDLEQLKPVKDRSINWVNVCDETIYLTKNFRVKNKHTKYIVDHFKQYKKLPFNLTRKKLEELTFDEDTYYIANTNQMLSQLQCHFFGKKSTKVGDVLLTFGGCDKTILRKNKFGKLVNYFNNNDLMVVKSDPVLYCEGLYLCEVERFDKVRIETNKYNKTPKVLIGDYHVYKDTLKARFSEVKAFNKSLKIKYKVRTNSGVKRKATDSENKQLIQLWVAYFNIKNQPYARHSQFRTTYKSQGKSFKHVVIVWNDLPTNDHKVVALGRAMESITII